MKLGEVDRRHIVEFVCANGFKFEEMDVLFDGIMDYILHINGHDYKFMRKVQPILSIFIDFIADSLHFDRSCKITLLSHFRLPS